MCHAHRRSATQAPSSVDLPNPAAAVTVVSRTPNARSSRRAAPGAAARSRLSVSSPSTRGSASIPRYFDACAIAMDDRGRFAFPRDVLKPVRSAARMLGSHPGPTTTEVTMRLVSRLVPPAAIAALATAALAIPAAPASAEPHDACATATAVFQSHMNQARYRIGAADRLADAGYEDLAQQATDRVDFYLNLAEAALNVMTIRC